MSKLFCKKCKSTNIHITEYPIPTDSTAVCYDCGHFDLVKDFPVLTIFHQITVSEEALAEKLVFNIPFVTVGGKGFDRWYSTIEPFDEDIYYYTEAEAFAATVAKLKEVSK